MKVEDKSIIKEVVFKYPEFVSSNAEELVKREYDNILSDRQTLIDLRMKVIDLEKRLKERENKFRGLNNSLFTLVFEEKEIDYNTTTCNLGVINPTDASNKNYGK